MKLRCLTPIHRVPGLKINPLCAERGALAFRFLVNEKGILIFLIEDW